jgi:hypothetical protein
MSIRVIITIIAAFTFYLLFSEDLTHIFNKLFSQHVERNKIAPAGQHAPLPPAHSIPVPSLGSHRVHTAEIGQPPSVTEQTTILLDKNKQ